MAAYYLGNLLKGYALLGDGVEVARLRAMLERQPVNSGGVQPVHGWPAIQPSPI